MVHFCCFRPIYPEEELDEENIIEDDAELDLNTMPDTKDEVCRIVNELIVDIMPNPIVKLFPHMQYMSHYWVKVTTTCLGHVYNSSLIKYAIQITDWPDKVRWLVQLRSPGVLRQFVLCGGSLDFILKSNNFIYKMPYI